MVLWMGPSMSPLQLLWVRMGSLHATQQTSLPAPSVQVLYALHVALLQLPWPHLRTAALLWPMVKASGEDDGCICLLLPATLERRPPVSGSQANLERFPSLASSLAESLAGGRASHWRMAKTA